MNKLRLLIVSEQNDFDKILSNKIKKFSSERNLFFTNLYNNSINSSSNNTLNSISSEKPSKVSNYKSFFRGTLLKRCKSSKDVYTEPIVTLEDAVENGRNDENETATESSTDPLPPIECDNVKAPIKMKATPPPPSQDTLKRRSHRHSFNLDEFDRNYLFSQNRKNIVKELRKNFEQTFKNGTLPNPSANGSTPTTPTTPSTPEVNKVLESPPVSTPAAPNDLYNTATKQIITVNGTPPPPPSVVTTKPPVPGGVGNKKIPTPFKKCEVAANDIQKRMSMCEKPPTIIEGRPPLANVKRPIARHSFYLHRNESDTYEVTSNYDDCLRVKNKARQLIEMFARNELPLQPPLLNKSECYNDNVDVNNSRNNSMNSINCTYNINSIDNNCKISSSNISIDQENFDAIFVTRNNLLNNQSSQLQQIQRRRTLNAAIARDNNLYRNLLSDSFEDSKFGIKKSGSVNKIDLEILKCELDDYVDPTWRANVCLGYGFRSQRTIANRKELDLEQKIDLEIKMREGSAKLLAACNNPKNSSNGGTGGIAGSNAHSTQILEAAKNLLTSNERMTAYMAELQRRKRDRDTITKTRPQGKVSLSEIRMPLMWRDSDHFKNKGDHRRFAVFCLAKIGTEIYDTSLLCPVDRNLTDVCFNDAILFTNIKPDFELKLEVYAVMMESDLSIASTPRKIKNTIHSSISRTVGRRLAANLKDELNNTKIGPKFELIATAHLTLADASEIAHTHDLCLTPNNATVHVNNKLPLFGHFCCRLAVYPDFYEQATQSGLLCMLPKGPARQVEGYARLQAFRVDLWDDEKAFQANYQPRRSVDVTRETKAKLKTETDLSLNNLEEGVMEEYVFRAPSSTDAQKWYSAVKKAIKEHIQWGHIMQSEPMQLAVPGNSKSYFTRSTRQGSLYDQVPILESIDIRQSTRPTVHDIFSIPASGNTSPSLNDFRNRTYSSGRSSSHSSSTLSAGSVGSINSRKSHWPFSSK